MFSSISLQILPLGQGEDKERIAVIDAVIRFLQKQDEVRMMVTPFETVLEGDFDRLMAILKAAIECAGEKNSNIFANVKINYGKILSMDEKLQNYVSQKNDTP